ncbi:MAG: hypothetical protein MUD14_11105 [Hydrococcus sp. Prado102]|nr:hypothetical protein [Hydrococcus sp. Prado102]
MGSVCPTLITIKDAISLGAARGAIAPQDLIALMKYREKRASETLKS